MKPTVRYSKRTEHWRAAAMANIYELTGIRYARIYTLDKKIKCDKDAFT